MVQLGTDFLRVLDGAGEPVLLDIGRLEHDLAESFRSLGFQDLWMVEVISITVEERVMASEKTPLHEHDVETLVLSILRVSGYSDVAVHFAKLRHHDLFAGTQRRMQTWSFDQIFTLLRRGLPLMEAQARKMAHRVQDALELLHLKRATPSFLMELALHFWEEAGTDFAEKHPSRRKGRIAKWESELSSDARKYLREGILGILPVADSIPRGTVALNLSVAMKQMGMGDFISDFSLYQTVQKLAPSLKEVLSCLHKEMRDEYAGEEVPPVLLLFPSFFSCLEGWMKSPEEQKAFQMTLRSLLEEYLIQPLAFPVSVYFR